MKKQAYALYISLCMLTIIPNALRMAKYNDITEFVSIGEL